MGWDGFGLARVLGRSGFFSGVGVSRQSTMAVMTRFGSSRGGDREREGVSGARCERRDAMLLGQIR